MELVLNTGDWLKIGDIKQASIIVNSILIFNPARFIKALYDIVMMDFQQLVCAIVTSSNNK